MNPERYRQIGELYHAALEVASGERAAFLTRECGHDEDLRHEVESLINSHQQAGAFIDKSALNVAAEILANQKNDILIGQTIAHYKVLSLVGTGGMGRVYSAEDTTLGRRVALKLLPESFTNDKNQMQRFHQEARAASALNHPNILTVYEVGQWCGQDFIVTEFVEGVTLRTRMRRRLSLAAAIDIALQIASALSAAHAAGIVHRDIKPENVMVRPDGLVKILDFGVAKYVERRRDSGSWVKTATGVVIGTTAYMSPEQARGQEVDGRTDIWSLGVILYEMIARHLPFPGKTPTDRMAAILEREPQPLNKQSREVPDQLEAIIRRALTKNKEERYARIADLAEDLRRLRVTFGEERPFRFGLPSPSSYLSSSRRWSVIAAAVLLVIGIAALALYSRARTTRAPDVVSSSTTIDSIAVLPLATAGASADVDYMADGITESLINQISQLPSLKVMSRNSVFRFKGQTVDAQQVSQTLGVRSVMMGSLKQLDDQLVINVELIDARDGSVVWTHQYIRKVADVIALQTNVAQDVTENLRLKLSGSEQQQLAKHYTNNAEAYDLYLKGLYFWNKNRRAPEDFKRSIEYFQRAIALDSNFALPYVGLSNCYHQQMVYSEMSSIELMPKARAAVARALELDDTISEAHSTLGGLNDLEGDRIGAEAELKRALELNPNNASAHHYYGAHLTAVGHFEEAIVNRQAALQLDPLSAPKRSAFAWTLYFAGKYDESIAECRETLAIEEDFYRAYLYLGLNYERQGNYEQAISEMNKALALAKDNAETLASIAHVYSSSGNKTEAERLLDRLNVLSKQKYVNPYFLAVVQAGLGQKEQAIQSLEKAVADHSIMLLWLKIEPRFDLIHSDPRFQSLLQRVHLA